MVLSIDFHSLPLLDCMHASLYARDLISHSFGSTNFNTNASNNLSINLSSLSAIQILGSGTFYIEYSSNASKTRRVASKRKRTSSTVLAKPNVLTERSTNTIIAKAIDKPAAKKVVKPSIKCSIITILPDGAAPPAPRKFLLEWTDTGEEVLTKLESIQCEILPRPDPAYGSLHYRKKLCYYTTTPKGNSKSSRTMFLGSETWKVVLWDLHAHRPRGRKSLPRALVFEWELVPRVSVPAVPAQIECPYSAERLLAEGTAAERTVEWVRSTRKKLKIRSDSSNRDNNGVMSQGPAILSDLKNRQRCKSCSLPAYTLCYFDPVNNTHMRMNIEVVTQRQIDFKQAFKLGRAPVEYPPPLPEPCQRLRMASESSSASDVSEVGYEKPQPAHPMTHLTALASFQHSRATIRQVSSPSDSTRSRCCPMSICWDVGPAEEEAMLRDWIGYAMRHDYSLQCLSIDAIVDNLFEDNVMYETLVDHIYTAKDPKAPLEAWRWSKYGIPRLLQFFMIEFHSEWYVDYRQRKLAWESIT